MNAATSLSPLKAPARFLRRRSALVDRLATYVETGHQLVTSDPVLIFSIGKVGTTSVAASIETATGRPVIKAHGLSDEGLRIRLERESELTDRPRGIWANQWLRRDLALRRRHRWQIISGVRDPVAIAASAYFYNRRMHLAAGQTVPVADDDVAGHARGVESIIEHFTHHEDWFRDEMQTVTGIDVFAEPFSTDDGHARYSLGRFSLLTLRQEDLRRVGPSALGEFLGLDGSCELPERNMGVEDPVYARFRTERQLDRSVVEASYATRFAQHFYAPDELERMAAKWL